MLKASIPIVQQSAYKRHSAQEKIYTNDLTKPLTCKI